MLAVTTGIVEIRMDRAYSKAVGNRECSLSRDGKKYRNISASFRKIAYKDYARIISFCSLLYHLVGKIKYIHVYSII